MLLCVQPQAVVLQVDAATLRILRLCDGARTLEDHVEHLREAVEADEPVIRALLEAFVAAALLAPVETTDMSICQNEAAATIGAIGIITAGRPSLLARGLTDAVSQIRRYDRDVRVFVVDGSRSIRDRRLTEAATARIGEGSVTYIGRCESEAIALRIAEESKCDPDLLMQSLCGGTAGANRNLLLLLTAGQLVLTVDDDVRWATWRLGSPDNRVAFAGHADLRRVAFFPTRAAAVGAIESRPVDLIGSHETLLGHTAWSLLKGEADLSRICRHLLNLSPPTRTPTVRVTFSGLAGDAAIHCPYQLLLTEGVTRSVLTSNPQMFEWAFTTREMYRIAPQPVVIHDAPCMTFCAGLANDELLPPFPWVGRNQDGVFGAMLSAIDQGALFGHLPCGIIHDSNRTAARPKGSIPSATQTRLADFVLSLMRVMTVNLGGRSPGERLRFIGRMILGVGQLTVDEFYEVLVEAVLDNRCRELVYLDSVLDENPSYPKTWFRAALRFRRRFLASAINPEFYCPIEFVGSSRDDRLRATQRFLCAFGGVLLMWADVWPIAARLQCDGAFTSRRGVFS